MNMKKYPMKRAAAMLAAVVMSAASVTGCESSTDYSMTANGTKINAGVYINYILNEMTTQMYTLYYGGEITEMKDCLDKDIEGTNFKTYVKNKALESTKEFAAVRAKFDELGLTLEDQYVQLIDDNVSSTWSSQKDFYEIEGVSRESLKQCMEHSYKKEAIFDYYYDEGGVEAVSDEDVGKYLADNYVRYKLITISKSSEEDEEAAKAENEELKALWEGYISEAEGVDFDGFDAIIQEYNDYKDAKAAEEEAAEDDGTQELTVGEDGTLDLGELDVTPAEDGSDDENAADDVDSDIEPTEEETAVEGEISEAEAAAEESTAEETVSAEDSSAEESAESAAEDTSSEESSAPEEEGADSTESTESAAEDTEADSAEDTDSADESAEDTESGSDTATVDLGELTAEGETDPYENETIVNYTNSTDTEYEYYSENYADLLTQIKNAEYGKATSYENDSYYYIFMSADIAERTDYAEDNRDDLIHEIKDDEFDGLVKGWIEACSIVVNEKAVKRYTVQEVYDREEEYSAKNA